MSEVILDTITGKSTATTITIGSTPVVSASANSMTIRGEGSKQTSIQQGLAKAWFNVNQTGTQAFRDNFNFSSLTDVVVGGTKLAFTNPFSSEGYAAGNMAKPTDGGGYAILRMSEPVSTTEFQFLGEDASDTNTDCHTATGMMTGDLA